MEFAKVQNSVKKVKKKPVSNELDRIKQAEKKKRRLEKALANSAAIRSELEKKKQMKIEEQERLDQEGAAIAEAVALNVLLGEDSNDNLNNICNSISNNFPLIGQMELSRPYRYFPEHEIEVIGWGSRRSSVLSGHFRENIYFPYNDEISADVIVAQAVASLRLSEDAHYDPRVFYSVLRG